MELRARRDVWVAALGTALAASLALAPDMQAVHVGRAALTAPLLVPLWRRAIALRAPRVWVAIAAAVTLLPLGDLVILLTGSPATGELLYLGAYAVGLSAAVEIHRRRGRGAGEGPRSRVVLVDALTVTAGTAMILWTFTFRDGVAGVGGTAVLQIVAGTIVAGVLAGLFASPGRPPVVLSWISAALVTAVLGEVVQSQLPGAPVGGAITTVTRVLLIAAVLSPNPNALLRRSERHLSQTPRVLVVSTVLAIYVVLNAAVQLGIADLDEALGLPALVGVLLWRVWRLVRHSGEETQAALRSGLADDLTGLANRRAILERIQQMVLEHGSATVMCLDLESFRGINERFGLQVGDRALQLIADRLVTAAGPDAAVGRLGGDEFLVVHPGSCDPAEHTRRSHMLGGAVSAPMHLPEGSMWVGVSIGTAVAVADPAGAVDPFEVVGRADADLREARKRSVVSRADRALRRHRSSGSLAPILPSPAAARDASTAGPAQPPVSASSSSPVSGT